MKKVFRIIIILLISSTVCFAQHKYKVEDVLFHGKDSIEDKGGQKLYIDKKDSIFIRYYNNCMEVSYPSNQLYILYYGTTKLEILDKKEEYIKVNNKAMNNKGKDCLIELLWHKNILQKVVIKEEDQEIEYIIKI